VPNSTLCNGLEFVSIRLLEKQLSFAGHCIRSNQPISDLLLWDPTKCKCSKGVSNANYSRQLLKANGRVDGQQQQQHRFSREYLGDQLVNNYTTNIKLQRYILHQCHLNMRTAAISTSTARRSLYYTKSRVSNAYIHPQCSPFFMRYLIRLFT
jgi:hypothetical protein